MPFTFSHPAAVLPLALIRKKWVSVTAMVAGSITPDFEYFFRMQQESYYSHTWGGIFWFDLPLALLLVYLFNELIKQPLIENLPEFLNRKFSKYRGLTRNLNNAKSLLFVVISLLIGILSHIIWDKLTHKSVSLIDKEEHYTIFWEANSVVGAILIAAVVLNMRAGERIQRKNIVLYWLPVAIITGTVIYIRFLSTSHLRDLGISAIVGFFCGLIITSVIAKLKHTSPMQLIVRKDN